MHSNLFQGGPYGVKGSDAGAGNGTLEAIRARRGVPAERRGRRRLLELPGETACPPRMVEVGFVNALKGNFRAGVGALRNRALDGGDIGADIDRVEAATRGAIVAP